MRGVALLSLSLLASSAACVSGSTTGVPAGGAAAAGASAAPAGASSAGAAGAMAAPDLGSVVLHRLNRAEYNNTVHDLLGTSLTPADTFPPDGASAGFDNNASALTLSTTSLRQMQTAAETLAAEATNPNGATLARIAPCNEMPEATCVEQFVRSFGLRVWRRPLTDAEVTSMVSVAGSGVEKFQDSYAQQIERGLLAFLISPHFSFRVELDAQPLSIASHPLSAYELATRLSYFVWSSTPDDDLLAAAKDGSLLGDVVLGKQLERLLADPRARAFSENFAGQWLQLRAAATFAPDTALFPAWNTALREDMVKQTKLAFADLLDGTSTLGDLFLSDRSYLNDRLATFYGLPLPGSTELKKVQLPAGPRRGLLGQGAVLSAQSLPVRTSIVHRGQFIQEHLFCATVPPPPANIPTLPPTTATGSQRQRLEAHVSSPVCASCHKAMDPYGFVLEQFDAIGALRTLDGQVPIDTSAKLPDGTPVANVQELQAVMAADPRIANCFARQIATYALGRTLATDDPSLLALQTDFSKAGQHVDQALRQVVMSPAFRTRHGGL